MRIGLIVKDPSKIPQRLPRGFETPSHQIERLYCRNTGSINITSPAMGWYRSCQPSIFIFYPSGSNLYQLTVQIMECITYTERIRPGGIVADRGKVPIHWEVLRVLRLEKRSASGTSLRISGPTLLARFTLRTEASDAWRDKQQRSKMTVLQPSRHREENLASSRWINSDTNCVEMRRNRGGMPFRTKVQISNIIQNGNERRRANA